MTSEALPSCFISGGDRARHHTGHPAPGCAIPTGTHVLRETRADPRWGRRLRNLIRVMPVRFDALRKSNLPVDHVLGVNYAILRTDARFQELIRNVGFPQYLRWTITFRWLH